MKKSFIPLLLGLATAALLSGCVLSIGGGRKTNSTSNEEHHAIGQQLTAPTTGQQLIDLQKARDCGVITDAEYQAQKTKLLENK